MLQSGKIHKDHLESYIKLENFIISVFLREEQRTKNQKKRGGGGRRGMQRHRDSRKKANFLRRLLLKKKKKKVLDHSASFVSLLFRDTHSLQAEKREQRIAHCSFKIRLKTGVTCLITSEVSKLICHEHSPLPPLAGNSASVGLSDT